MRQRQITLWISLAVLAVGVAGQCEDGSQCFVRRDSLYVGSSNCVNLYGTSGTRCIQFSGMGFTDFCCPVSCGECVADPAVTCADPTDFQCSNGNCIAADRECDGITHCSDGGDEEFCTRSPSPSPSISPGACFDGIGCLEIDMGDFTSANCDSLYAAPNGIRCLANPDFCCPRSCGICESFTPTPSPSTTLSASRSPSVSVSRNCVEGSVCSQPGFVGRLSPGSEVCDQLVGEGGELCAANPNDCCPVSCGHCPTETPSASLSLSPSIPPTPSTSMSATASISRSNSPSPTTVRFFADLVLALGGVTRQTLSTPAFQQDFTEAIESLVLVPIVVTYPSVATSGPVVMTVRIAVEVAQDIPGMTTNASRTDLLASTANSILTGTTISSLDLVSLYVTDAGLIYECLDDPLCAPIQSVLVPNSQACLQQYQEGASCSLNASFCCPLSCGQCGRSSTSPSPSPSSFPADIVQTKTVSDSETVDTTVALAVVLPIITAMGACCIFVMKRRKETKYDNLRIVFRKIGDLENPDVDSLDAGSLKSAEDELLRVRAMLQDRMARMNRQNSSNVGPLVDNAETGELMTRPSPLPDIPISGDEDGGGMDTGRAGPMSPVPLPQRGDSLVVDGSSDRGSTSARSIHADGPGRINESTRMLPGSSSPALRSLSTRSFGGNKASPPDDRLVHSLPMQSPEIASSSDDFSAPPTERSVSLADASGRLDEDLLQVIDPADRSINRASTLASGLAPDDNDDQEFHRRMQAFAEATAQAYQSSSSSSSEDLKKPKGDDEEPPSYESHPTLESDFSKGSGSSRGSDHGASSSVRESDKIELDEESSDEEKETPQRSLTVSNLSPFYETAAVGGPYRTATSPNLMPGAEASPAGQERLPSRVSFVDHKSSSSSNNLLEADLDDSPFSTESHSNKMRKAMTPTPSTHLMRVMTPAPGEKHMTPDGRTLSRVVNSFEDESEEEAHPSDSPEDDDEVMLGNDSGDDDTGAGSSK